MARNVGTADHVAAPSRLAAEPVNQLTAMAATAINPQIGGAHMLGTRTIAANCAAAPNLQILTRALTASDAGRALSTAGPVTVFAPSDEAFGRMSPHAVNALLSPVNRATLNKLVNYHVVRGAITLDQLRARIDQGGGTAHLTTVEGASLVARKEGAAVALTDANGNKSYVETPDVQQSDGVFHVINGVMIPRLA
ncbi:fasciclin domain-containing protein [Sphingomonas sp. IC-11]|uniref:fasciclin domain-containing protein n=1 Tax=Sphingomonas sp. IC-11 TaxID=2898528 RepID=UPI001E4FDAED|nr:fasciclin domain-containing protein [Sphingomonas sp. IC-11]